MTKQLVELYVHPLTIIYIALSLILGRFTFVFGMFAIAIIHEFFHIFAAYIFHLKVNCISITPIGCYADINELENAPRIAQIIILIMGPLSFFFSSAIIKYLTQIDIISIYRYRELIETNLLIMLFNLLPIFPLDGGRILKVIFSSLFSEKVSLRLKGISGIIFGISVAIYLFHIKQYLFAISLIFMAIINIINVKKDYLKFLYQRIIINLPRRYRKRLNNKPIVYRFFNNYYLSSKGIVNEKKYLSKIIKKETT